MSTQLTMKDSPSYGRTHECCHCGYRTTDPDECTGQVDGHKETVCIGCGTVRSFSEVER